MKLVAGVLALVLSSVAVVESRLGGSTSHDHHLIARRAGLLPKRSTSRCPSTGRNTTKLITPGPNQLSAAQISLVTNNCKQHAVHSWEIGTYEQALLELNAPDLYLYSANSIPPVLSDSDDVKDVWASVDAVLAQIPKGSLTFFEDIANGDPASVGIPFLIRNQTLNEGNSKYAIAAINELNYLLYHAQRMPSGAISQRQDPEPPQMWADCMSMVPGFIAYAGALEGNLTLLLKGYTELELYYNALYDPQAKLLHHIIMGLANTQDPGHWATGNGWALRGMLHVLRIIQLSPFASQLATQQQNIIQWASALVNTIWTFQQSDGSLLNYIDKDPSETFKDASATALIAADTFRLATLVYGVTGAPSINVEAAEQAKQWIISSVGSDGWLAPVVNPMNWHAQGEHSPEGQAFVLLLMAAERDFYTATAGQYR